VFLFYKKEFVFVSQSSGNDREDLEKLVSQSTHNRGRNHFDDGEKYI
jgi:hypothetical protein